MCRNADCHSDFTGPHRIDPPDCGCTDCLVGWSVPLYRATKFQLAAMMAGYVQNATGIKTNGFSADIEVTHDDIPGWYFT